MEVDKDSSVSYTAVQMIRVHNASQSAAYTPASYPEVVSEAQDDGEGNKHHHCDEHHKKDCSLPIMWGPFTLANKGNYIHVQFITKMEILVDRFEVQRSTDGKNYRTIAIVWPGGSPYVYKDYMTDLK
jgi:hypothetical protein